MDVGSVRHAGLLLHLSLAVAATAPAAPPRRVAIVGGGLAGLASAVALLDAAHPPLEALHILDPAEVGTGGASAAAAGLLHPFTRTGGEIWRGREGFAAAVALTERAEAHRRGAPPLASQTGLLRVARTAAQAERLRGLGAAAAAAAAAAPATLEQRWLERDAAAHHAGGVKLGDDALGAAHAPAAITIDVPRYLCALWAMCREQGAAAGTEVEWRPERVGSLASLAPGGAAYDAVLCTAGARVLSMTELAALPLTPCRSQNLLFPNEAGLASPLIAGRYVIPKDGAATLLVGATFEYDEAESCYRAPEPDEAEAALRPVIAELFPPLRTARPVGCQAGVRALPPRSHLGRVPIAGRLRGEAGGAPCWLLGGLGSRGLIHHALLGKCMAEAILTGDERALPPHTRRLQLGERSWRQSSERSERSERPAMSKLKID